MLLWVSGTLMANLEEVRNSANRDFVFKGGHGHTHSEWDFLKKAAVHVTLLHRNRGGVCTKLFCNSDKGSSQAEATITHTLRSPFPLGDGAVGEPRQSSNKFICSGGTTDPALPTSPSQEFLS